MSAGDVQLVSVEEGTPDGLTVQDLAPQGQALKNVRVLFLVIVRQPSTSAPTSDSKRWLRFGRVEVLLQVADHLVAGVAVHPKECVIVTDAIQALRETFSDRQGFH